MFTPILVHYLNICMNCIIVSRKTPQILTVQFRLSQNLEFFVKKQAKSNDT